MPERMFIIGNTQGYGYHEGLYVSRICRPRWAWTTDMNQALTFTEETARRITHRKRCVKLIEIIVMPR